MSDKFKVNFRIVGPAAVVVTLLYIFLGKSVSVVPEAGAVEHTLLINERGEYELVAYHRMSAPSDITAYQFSRAGANWVVYWHKTGAQHLWLPIRMTCMECYDRLDAQPLSVTEQKNGTVIPVSGRRYIKTNLPTDVLKDAFGNAEVLSE